MFSMESLLMASRVVLPMAMTVGIGMLLQGLGLLSAGPDEDDKEDAFEDLNGWQDYALTLPDGTNLTIDCFNVGHTSATRQQNCSAMRGS